MDLIVHMRVASADLLTGLNAVLRAVDVNPKRENCRGVCFSTGGDLLLVGTNAERLHFYYVADAADHDLPVTRRIISREDAQRIQSWLREDPPDVVRVSLGPGYVNVDDIRLREREPRGVYPDYDTILAPKREGAPHIEVDRKTLLDALQKGSQTVRLKVGIQQVLLEDYDGRVEFNPVPILRYNFGKAETFQSILINSSYLKDALRTCPTATVTLYRVELATVPVLYVVPSIPGFLGIIAHKVDYKHTQGDDNENLDEAEGVSGEQNRSRFKRDRTLS